MMNSNILKMVTGLCAFSMLFSCNYEEVNTNPYGMTEEMGRWDGVALGGNFTAMQRWVVPVGTKADDTDMINEYQRAYNLSADCWAGYFSQDNNWNSGNNSTAYFSYDDWNSATYKNSYTEILPLWKKIKETGTPEEYAIAQILKISAWHKTLEAFGPIPYTHAGESALVIPFDSEKDVYDAMFADLQAAVEDLYSLAAMGGSIAGEFDAVYAGSAERWIRYANSLMLRLAMHIRFADDATARKWASQALGNHAGLIETVADEAKINRGAGYVFVNNINYLARNYNEARMGASIFSYLDGYEDPRLSAYFTEGNVNGRSIRGYDGKEYYPLPAGNISNKGDFAGASLPNMSEDTPIYWMRASEVFFLRAEAALAWGGGFGDAGDLYRQGVEMSFAENGVSGSVDDYLANGTSPVAVSLTGQAYDRPAPTDATAEFTGSDEQKLEKIMIQKWIALYPNGMEAWTEFRRTGYPKLLSVKNNRGAADGVTMEHGMRRMKYPVSFSQSSQDKANYDAAVELLGGPDSPVTRLYFDKHVNIK